MAIPVFLGSWFILGGPLSVVPVVLTGCFNLLGIDTPIGMGMHVLSGVSFLFAEFVGLTSLREWVVACFGKFKK